MNKAFGQWPWTLLMGFVIGLSAPARSQSFEKPSWSEKLNNRTIVIKRGWEQDFQLTKDAHIIASIQLSSDTDWENPDNPAVLVGVSVDRRLVSHVVTFMGREFHQYQVHLGRVPAGNRTLEVLRADSSATELKIANVILEGYEEDHPQFSILEHAPLIFGRPEMRKSDVPLLMAYRVHDGESKPGEPQAEIRAIDYTVFYSNEDGGTSPVGLLHRWGRYADIEWAYRVEFATDTTESLAYFQAEGHDTLVFRGGFENKQPTLQVVTLNNMLSDSLTTKLRFSLPPIYQLPSRRPRESVLSEAPWVWRVCAGEARREQKLIGVHTDSTRIDDLRNYLFVQFAAQPLVDSLESGGFFIAKFRNRHGEYASNLWRPDLVIRSDQPFARQTAIPLPPGTAPEDLLRLDFVADQSGGDIALTDIYQLLSLDEHDVPRGWRPTWSGRIELHPGESVRFHVDGFQLLRSKYQPLAERWYFKPDPWNQGSVQKWGDGDIHESLWPTLRVGESWHEQGYSGYEGPAWYRTHFFLDRSWRGEKVWLGFGRVDGKCELWVNNEPVEFSVPTTGPRYEVYRVAEVTPHVKIESDNTLAVRVEGRLRSGGISEGPVGIANRAEVIAMQTAWPMAELKADYDSTFEYLSRPWALIGTQPGRYYTQVAPEGYLFTGFAEFMLFGGSQMRPLTCGTKSLAQDFLPIVQYGAQSDGIQYAFETFALPASDKSTARALNYLQVTLTNTDSVASAATFGIGVRFRGVTHRFPAQIKFDPTWRYSRSGRFLVRDDRVICVLPEQKPDSLWFANDRNRSPGLLSGLVSYRFRLAAGESRQLSFCIPQEPSASGDLDKNRSQRFRFDRLRREAIKTWEEFLHDAGQFLVPEPKVTNAVRANLIYNAIVYSNDSVHDYAAGAGDQDEEWTISSYLDAFRAFDLAGQHELARVHLRRMIEYLSESGRLGGARAGSAQNGAGRDVAPEIAFGQLLWALGQHLDLNRDSKFGRQTMPMIKKAVLWFNDVRLKDPRNLLGAGAWSDQPADLRYSVGANLLALLGLRHAANIARLSGENEDYRLFLQIYQTLSHDFLGQLRAEAAATHGYVPPYFGSSAGVDGANLMAAYPAGVLDPSDSLVIRTMQIMRGRFEEGLLTSGDGRWLNPYLTTIVAHTALLHGEMKTVIEDLYALLLHTSTAHIPIGNRFHPWGDRDNHGPLSPLNPSGSRLIALIRDMLVREEGTVLHLFSALSPAWLMEGRVIELKDVATKFGKFSATAQVRANKWTIEISPDWQARPGKIVLHLPYFLNVSQILVDGAKASIRERKINLPANARKIEVLWSGRDDTETTSFAATVRDFKREYAGRFELWRMDQP